jgi:uncharacterized protein (TIGR02466 family)
MIKQLWSTPFYQSEMSSDICDKMTQTILQEYDLFNTRTELGSTNILDNPHEVIQQFKNEVVYPAFNKFLNESLDKSISDWNGHRAHGWIARYGTGQSLTHHNHRGSQLSAVFYLMCDNVEDKGGQIIFTDPRQNSNRGYDTTFQEWFKGHEITPKNGDVVVFPSYLYHYVTTYQSNIRIALPVDLFLFNNL